MIIVSLPLTHLSKTWIFTLSYWGNGKWNTKYCWWIHSSPYTTSTCLTVENRLKPAEMTTSEVAQWMHPLYVKEVYKLRYKDMIKLCRRWIYYIQKLYTIWICPCLLCTRRPCAIKNIPEFSMQNLETGEYKPTHRTCLPCYYSQKR